MRLATAFSTVLLAMAAASQLVAEVTKPNIVLILADDLGYGDVQCLNPERGKIPTPHIDQLAAEGMIFTDAHSSSSVCTPTRYGLLTGRYNWRTRLQRFVLYGYDKPLIAADRLTVAGLLQKNGYTTACIGKWHLGMGLPEGEPDPKITDGPLTRGFGTFFGISASLDMPPYAFIDGDRFTQPLTTTKTWMRTGAAAEDFEAIDVLPTFTRKAIDFIEAEAKTDKPFFLYMPLTSPHTPIVPNKEWQKKSPIGRYGDFVMETDAIVGEITNSLKRAGVRDNTLIIVTADNGCSKAARVPDMEKKGHYPSADLRGLKTDIFEGGHRVPFIARWPDRIEAGSRSDQTICLNDVMATSAEIVGVTLPDNAGEDSVSILPALLGKPIPNQREALVHHAMEGDFAIRQGKWKLILCSHSGGVSDPKYNSEKSRTLPENQLYDLSADLGETRNLQAEHPEVVAELTKQLEKIIANGRSTPGEAQKNDAPIKLRKVHKIKK
ncbi:sulfatase family protein [Haloferula rosea]|uniref:Arylsulfatase n=1 Tax=Haloferula rosea TaxID=490093 RepID=A0A934VGI5_9BACT|nr:arylsulfatase [Haloferula rosea]MBK1827630.1 arylsulfatase [Haloferula rosea]